MREVELSVVIPAAREGAPLARFVDFVRAALGDRRTYEILLVVDGDLPRYLEEAHRLADEHENIRVLHFARHFGEGAALQAGLMAAKGAILVTHPAYFQVSAEVLPRLVEAVEQGADVAFASRLPVSDSLFNRFQRRAFNLMMRVLLGIRHRDVACGVRALRRETLEDIATHGAFHRFLTVTAIMRGYVVQEIDAPLHPDARHTRRYSPLTYLRRILDIANLFFLTKFQYKPFRFFGLVGSLLFLPGFLICAFLSLYKIFVGIPLGNRPLFLFGVILAVLGFQIIAIGLLGEIISFTHAGRTKVYAVRELVRKSPGKATAKGATTAASDRAES